MRCEKNKVIIFLLTLNIFFLSSCNRKPFVVHDKTDIQETTDSILYADAINYSLNENLEEISDCKSHPKKEINIFWGGVEEVVILPAIQKDNRLFCVSDDSICSVILDVIKEDNLDYKQGEKILHCFIEMDTLGNIIHIDLLSYSKSDFAKKSENF